MSRGSGLNETLYDRLDKRSYCVSFRPLPWDIFLLCWGIWYFKKHQTGSLIFLVAILSIKLWFKVRLGHNECLSTLLCDSIELFDVWPIEMFGINQPLKNKHLLSLSSMIHRLGSLSWKFLSLFPNVNNYLSCWQKSTCTFSNLSLRFMAPMENHTTFYWKVTKIWDRMNA